MGQVVIADAHSNMALKHSVADNVTQDSVKPACHGDNQIGSPAVSSNILSSSANEECCDANCPMTACHFVNVILTSIQLDTLGYKTQASYTLLSANVNKPVSSLYRPPILG